MLTIKQDHMMYVSWDIKCKGQSFFSFWTNFCPLTLLTTQAIKILKKKKKKTHQMLSFYTCVPQMTIMMYGSWNIKHKSQNFLSFSAIFCPFTALTVHKIKILKKTKKVPGDIIILLKCTKNDHHTIYGSWNINCNRQIFFLVFGHFLPFHLAPPSYPLRPKK